MSSPDAPAAPPDGAPLIADLRRDEGVKRFAYQDSLGFWTIGVGRLVDSRKGGGLSDAEIDLLLANDIAALRAQLDRAIPWWRGLDPVRGRVIENMAFNLGCAGLLGFPRMLEAVRTGDWRSAAAAMLASRWAGEVGPRADRLAQLIRTGRA
jgi:lysozyme